MENKINIAYITKDMPVNGISTVIMNYCRNIDRSAHDSKFDEALDMMSCK